MFHMGKSEFLKEAFDTANGLADEIKKKLQNLGSDDGEGTERGVGRAFIKTFHCSPLYRFAHQGSWMRLETERFTFCLRLTYEIYQLCEPRLGLLDGHEGRYIVIL